jgi:hypothetical protein
MGDQRSEKDTESDVEAELSDARRQSPAAARLDVTGTQVCAQHPGLGVGRRRGVVLPSGGNHRRRRCRERDRHHGRRRLRPRDPQDRRQALADPSRPARTSRRRAAQRRRRCLGARTGPGRIGLEAMEGMAVPAPLGTRRGRRHRVRRLAGHGHTRRAGRPTALGEHLWQRALREHLDRFTLRRRRPGRTRRPNSDDRPVRQLHHDRLGWTRRGTSAINHGQLPEHRNHRTLPTDRGVDPPLRELPQQTSRQQASVGYCLAGARRGSRWVVARRARLPGPAAERVTLELLAEAAHAGAAHGLACRAPVEAARTTARLALLGWPDQALGID